MKYASELNQIKNEPCVSIIISTAYTSPERKRINIDFKQSLKKTKELLEKIYPDAASQLLEQTEQLIKSLDYVHLKKGLGLYISASKKKVVKFPFPVNTKVIVSDSFELEEAILLDNYSLSYYILELNETLIKLFKGRLDEIEEVKDGVFPREYEEQYEYSRPSRGDSYVGHAYVKEFEKDKSILKGMRIQEFFLEADKALKKYLWHDSILLISGSNRNISFFREITHNSKSIMSAIKHNTLRTPINTLAENAWLRVLTIVKENRLNLLKKFEEKKGKGFGVDGIEEVWKAAKEGRGWKLLIESNCNQSDSSSQGADEPKKALPGKDLTSQSLRKKIIQTILDKKGEVFIYPTGELKNYRHIALLERYQSNRVQFWIL